jgi:hypothetical protein
MLGLVFVGIYVEYRGPVFERHVERGQSRE